MSASPSISRAIGRAGSLSGRCGGVLAAVTGLVLVVAPAEAVPRTLTPAGGSATEGGAVTVTGSGFGHGVGLSQYGALGMARHGASARSILTHFYTGTKVSGYRDDVDLRVNVVDRGTSVTLATEALARGGGRMRLQAGPKRRVDVPSGGAATVTIDGSSLKIVVSAPGRSKRTIKTRALTVQWSGARGLAGPASVLEVTSRSANATSTSGKKRSYRWGALRFTPVARVDSDKVTRTRVAGVATLNLHREYLSGMAEVPSSWHSSALKAQVIAARTYALSEYRGGSAAVCGGCHLWDDTRSQVYRGWDTESVAHRWVQAVRATQASRVSGLVVLYRGRPIRAYYSSSTGGRTRDAGIAMGKSQPYLVSVPDPWSLDQDVNPRFANWQRTLPLAKVAAAFGLPGVASIKVSEKDGAGAAVTVTAAAADGTSASLPGNTVRARLGLPALWLKKFEFTGSGSVTGEEP